MAGSSAAVCGLVPMTTVLGAGADGKPDVAAPPPGPLMPLLLHAVSSTRRELRMAPHNARRAVPCEGLMSGRSCGPSNACAPPWKKRQCTDGRVTTSQKAHIAYLGEHVGREEGFRGRD